MGGSGDAGVVLAASGTHVARGALLPVCLVAHWVVCSLEDFMSTCSKLCYCMCLGLPFQKHVFAFVRPFLAVSCLLSCRV